MTAVIPSKEALHTLRLLSLATRRKALRGGQTYTRVVSPPPPQPEWEQLSSSSSSSTNGSISTSGSRSRSRSKRGSRSRSSRTRRRTSYRVRTKDRGDAVSQALQSLSPVDLAKCICRAARLLPDEVCRWYVSARSMADLRRYSSYSAAAAAAQVVVVVGSSSSSTSSSSSSSSLSMPHHNLQKQQQQQEEEDGPETAEAQVDDAIMHDPSSSSSSKLEEENNQKLERRTLLHRKRIKEARTHLRRVLGAVTGNMLDLKRIMDLAYGVTGSLAHRRKRFLRDQMFRPEVLLRKPDSRSSVFPVAFAAKYHSNWEPLCSEVALDTEASVTSPSPVPPSLSDLHPVVALSFTDQDRFKEHLFIQTCHLPRWRRRMYKDLIGEMSRRPDSDLT